MKNLINSLSILAFAILGITTFTSCDPCATVVCPANSVCKTGSCACNDGYDKIGATCSAVNLRYGSGSYSVTEVADSASTQLYSTVKTYTITPNSLGTQYFTLDNFLGDSSNDVNFNISLTNADVITSTNVITDAGYQYTLSGAKTGSQIQLQLFRPATGITYTLTYTV